MNRFHLFNMKALTFYDICQEISQSLSIFISMAVGTCWYLTMTGWNGYNKQFYETLRIEVKEEIGYM